MRRDVIASDKPRRPSWWSHRDAAAPSVPEKRILNLSDENCIRSELPVSEESLDLLTFLHVIIDESLTLSRPRDDWIAAMNI